MCGACQKLVLCSPLLVLETNCTQIANLFEFLQIAAPREMPVNFLLHRQFGNSLFHLKNGYFEGNFYFCSTTFIQQYLILVTECL
jgi:hypothetical protein